MDSSCEGRLLCVYLFTPGNHLHVYVSGSAVPIMTKLFVWEGYSGGHVPRETTSRGLSGLVCPSRTSERGGEGDCVKEGGGGEGEREKESPLMVGPPCLINWRTVSSESVIFAGLF